MRLLRLALAGLWWRRATSLMLLVVAIVTAAASGAGASFLSSARDAVLQQTLARAPLGATGTGIEVTTELTGRPSTTAFGVAVRDAFDGTVRSVYPSVVTEAAVTQRLMRPALPAASRIELTSRQGLCEAVRVVAGHCVANEDRSGIVLEQAVAQRQHLTVGDVVAVVPLRGGAAKLSLRVRGIVTRLESASPYWFGSSSAPQADVLSVWAPSSYLSGLDAEPGDGVTATADVALNRSAVHVASISRLSRAIDGAARQLEAGTGHPTVTTAIDQVVQRGLAGGARLTAPILVTVVELVVLGWFLLHTLVSAAAEARGSEVALSKIRGMRTGRSLTLFLLEPALLLVASVPMGVLLAAVAERGLVAAALGPTVDVTISWTSWLAAATAAMGGLIAAAAASRTVLRRPVLEQWRRSGRDGDRRGAVAEVAIVVLAVAGVAQLEVSGSLDSGAASGIAVLAPALVILAGALLASRLVTLLARLSFPATRGSGAVAAFVGLRQLARRPAGRRTFAVIVVASAMAIYGLSSTQVLAQNRQQRALTDVGSATVLHVAADPRTDQRVRRADPSGRVATAVTAVPTEISARPGVFASGSAASASTSMLVVDPRSFANVAYWRTDFGSSSLKDLLKPLTSTAPSSPALTGTRVTFDVATTSVPSSLQLDADLTDARGVLRTVSLGPLRAGERTYSASVSACAGRCLLRRIYVSRPSGELGSLVTSFTVRGVRVTGNATGSQPSLVDARWSPLNPTPDVQSSPAETVTATAIGLRVVIAISGTPQADEPGFGAVAGAPERLPALVTKRVESSDSSVSAQSPDAATFSLRVTRSVAVLPRAGDAGVLIPRNWAIAASPSGYSHLLPDQIWLAPNAPKSIIIRLQKEGVTVRSVERASSLAVRFASQGPSFASTMLLVAGGTAVLLASAAVVLGLGLFARRRTFELSAMRALGIRTRTLFGTVFIEQAALIGAAVVFGAILGGLSVALALPALPAYVDDPAYPPFVVDQPVAVLALAALGIAVVLLAAAALSAAVLVRGTSVSRLREAEQ